MMKSSGLSFKREKEEKILRRRGRRSEMMGDDVIKLVRGMAGSDKVLLVPACFNVKSTVI